ncbi:hypothetical protein D556_0718 [Bordetella holmesii 41130]|nr:hypothetical protein D558_0711 [Bordetella holmesii 44057]EWM48705.1 hypothetical protein D556_0718 [Bordetella holmesii 41130]
MYQRHPGPLPLRHELTRCGHDQPATIMGQAGAPDLALRQIDAMT